MRNKNYGEPFMVLSLLYDKPYNLMVIQAKFNNKNK